jgi:Uma2 family endonuclease
MSTVEFAVTGPVLVLDPIARDAIIAQRRASGADRYDEVWKGTYIMSPLPSLEHQRLALRLSITFDKVVTDLGQGTVYPGANITDRAEDWTFNYRCPDVVVVLDESRIESLESAIVGGPDLLVEVASPGDRWPEKLEFYGSIGVRELLVVDCNTKELELFRARDRVLSSVGESTQSSPIELSSEVLPLTFKRTEASGKPQLEIRRNDGREGTWVIQSP